MYSACTAHYPSTDTTDNVRKAWLIITVISSLNKRSWVLSDKASDRNTAQNQACNHGSHFVVGTLSHETGT